MSKKTADIVEWRQAKNIEQMLSLIDQGIVLKWDDPKGISKALSNEEQLRFVDYLAKKFCERYEMRLSAEIIIETLLIWLAADSNERYIGHTLERMFEHPACEAAFYEYIDIVMNFETVEKTNSERIFCVGILSLCELGLAIKQVDALLPDLLEDGSKLLEHLSTYLLSVSNSTNNYIRLSLLSYFGSIEVGTPRQNFHKILGRFGHTILDHLFTLVFDKKTEAVSLRFLQENFAYILDTDADVQKTVFETMKYYMLKNPERYLLFIEAILKLSHSEEDDTFNEHSRKMLFKHLFLLFRITNEVNHRKLGTELMRFIATFKKIDTYQDHLKSLIEDASVKTAFKDIVHTVGLGRATKTELRLLRSGKRGRKPSMSKNTDMQTVEQILYLGSFETAKAS